MPILKSIDEIKSYAANLDDQGNLLQETGSLFLVETDKGDYLVVGARSQEGAIENLKAEDTEITINNIYAEGDEPSEEVEQEGEGTVGEFLQQKDVEGDTEELSSETPESTEEVPTEEEQPQEEEDLPEDEVLTEMSLERLLRL